MASQVKPAKIILVAELSANHAGSLKLALETLEAAADAGADAIKIQTYRADTITLDCQNQDFQVPKGTLWSGRTLYNLYQEAHTPWEWTADLQNKARALGIELFSTPFDKSAVDFLKPFDMPYCKIAGFEVNDTPLIEYAARQLGKPMILTAGLASLSEIEQAVAACRRGGCEDITLLKGVNSYPAPLEEMNLKMIPHLAKTFNVKAGLSDHSLGSAAAIAAAALGAVMIEKHFILNKKNGGPDAAFSMEPADFKRMAADIRAIEKALGSIDYSLSPSVQQSRRFMRSLYAAQDIALNEVFTEQNVKSVRPAFGLPPAALPQILGKRAARTLKKGDRLTWADLKH